MTVKITYNRCPIHFDIEVGQINYVMYTVVNIDKMFDSYELW